MKISEVYRKFSITPNLQEHMLTVTKVALFIADHWIGPELNKDRLKKAALVHDLGNIVKFDFVAHPEFLGDEQKRVGYWKKKQREIIEKYGDDDHEATKLMLNELGFDNDSIEVISSKSFANSIATKDSNNWSLKILLYSDLRVLPSGVGTLEERLKDILERMLQYNTRPDLENLFEACRDIERQIQANVTIPLSEINSKSIEKTHSDLLNENI